MYTPAEIVEKSKDYTLVSWSAQGAWNPVPIERGEGVYVWDASGKRYMDWSSQLVNVNVKQNSLQLLRLTKSELQESLRSGLQNTNKQPVLTRKKD